MALGELIFRHFDLVLVAAGIILVLFLVPSFGMIFLALSAKPSIELEFEVEE